MQESPLPSDFKAKYGVNVYNGLPYIGKVYDRKEKDSDIFQPVMVKTVNVRQFDLSKDDHMKEWLAICQKVSDGVSQISFEEKKYDETIKSWRVLIRWIDLAYTHPEGV